MGKRKSKERIVRLVMAILISAAAAAVILLIFPPHWETDDDWVMANMAAGVYGRAESYIPFIHPFLGIVLKKAYELIPGLPWLGLLWEGIVFASFTGILWSFQNSLGTKKGTLLWDCIFILFAPCFYTTVNFTRVAAIAAGAGYLMVFSGLKKKQYLPVAVGFALNWMGCAVRLGSWQMITALAGGLGLTELFWTDVKLSLKNVPKIIRSKKEYLIVFGILFLGCLAVCQTEKLYDSTNPQIVAYEEYNSARAKLLDYPMAEYATIREELEDLELSADQYSALKDDFIASDPEIFGEETLLALRELQDGVKLNLVGAAVSTWKLLISTQSVLCLAACFLLVWIAKDKKSPFLVLWLGGMVVLLNYYLVKTGRNPSRVVESISAVAAIYLLWKLEKEKEKVKFKAAAVLLALSLLLNSSVYFLPQSGSEKAMGEKELTVLAAMEELNQTGRYYLCGKTELNIQMYDLGMEGIGNLDFGSREHFFYTSGWWTNTPSYLNQLTEAGIMNPYRDILRYDNLLLIDQYKTGLVFAYIRSNYDHPWLPENWSVCRKIVDGLYVIGFNKDITADQVSTDIEWVQAAQIAGSEEDLIWFKVLFDGDESLKEKENIYYLQITDSQGETKTYRGEAQQTEAGLQLLVGIDRQEVQGEEVQVAVLRKNLEQRYEETDSVSVTVL